MFGFAPVKNFLRYRAATVTDQFEVQLAKVVAALEPLAIVPKAPVAEALSPRSKPVAPPASLVKSSAATPCQPAATPWKPLPLGPFATPFYAWFHLLPAATDDALLRSAARIIRSSRQLARMRAARSQSSPTKASSASS